MTRQIVVDIVGDAKGFTKATDQAVKSGGRFGKEAVKGFGLGVGLGVFSLATGALDTLVGSLGGAADAAKEDRKSVDLLALSYKNSAKSQSMSIEAVEAAIAANQKKGVSDDEQRAGIANFIDLTGDASEAVKLNAAVVELAAAKGLAYADAEAIIKSAAAGKTAALKKAGVEIEKGATAAEVATAVMGKYGGSLDAVAQTAEGKAAIANEKNADSMERIGEVVLRVSDVALPLLADAFSTIIDVLADVYAAVEPVIKTLVKELTPAFKTVVSFLTGTVMPVVKTLMDAYLKTLGTVISALMPVVKNVFGFIANFVGTEIAIVRNVIGALMPIITGIGTGVSTVVGVVGTAISKFVGFFTGLGSKIGNAVKGLFDGIPKAFKAALNFLIRMWNGLKFSLGPFDLGPLGKIGPWSLGTPNLPYFHSGGIVPGVPGSDVPAMLQAGERVIPASQAGRGGDIHIHIGMFVGSGPDIDRLANLIAQRIRVSGA